MENLKAFPHVQKAIQYCQDVVAGKILACKFVRLSCQRQLKDLARKRYAYEFDAELAEKVCRFIERMPHVKGRWARKVNGKCPCLVLEPWQCFLVTTLFGWVDRKTRLRRFRHAYWELPRKNAKSTLAAAIGLYLLTEDDEPGADVYCTATSHKQSADAVFGTAKTMARRAEGFADHYGVEILQFNINVPDEASKFEPLHAKADNLDGLNVHGDINDELHAHKTRDLRDVMVTGTGSREQPVILDITTAGYDTSGICYEVRDYVVKVLQNTIQDDQTFGIIYTIDTDDEKNKDDWKDEKIWIKANPNWNVSVFPMALRSEFKKAVANPSYQRTFQTKYLNVWCGAANAWMDMLAWDKCADPDLDITQFAGKECFPGVDLSSKIDLSVVMPVFPEMIDGKLHVFAFGMYYLPEKTIEESTNSQYSGWKRRGLLRATPGNLIDVDQIENDVEFELKPFDVVELCVDPMHNSTQFKTHMEEKSFVCVDVRPTVVNFSEPMKYLEGLVKADRFHHNGDPIMTWAISNVVAKMDQKDNIYPRRQREHNKIDPAIGIIMAMNRILATAGESDTIYDRGVGVGSI